MLMRGRGSALNRWLAERRHARLLMAIGFMCAAYSVIIVVTLLADGESDAPWLPSSAGKDEFLLAIAALFVAAGAGGFVHGTVDARRARILATGQNPHTSPLDRGASAYLLGVKWLFTGWRRWTIGLVLWLSLGIYAAGMLMPEVRQGVWERTSPQVWFMNLYAAAWMMWALVLKGRELRRGKEQIKVADEYLAIRESRMHAEVDAMCEKFLQQQQDWKAQKTAELYEQILDQQARGVLPCPNCHDQGEHRKSA
ncbi:hypothetical protein [Streptomyces sp. NPDC058614]|uniref:hypothetical protein n=1 Tax=Streptomyces sp. NPDC058614 TaxID=3346557 RepID=UPI003664BFCD